MGFARLAEEGWWAVAYSAVGDAGQVLGVDGGEGDDECDGGEEEAHFDGWVRGYGLMGGG